MPTVNWMLMISTLKAMALCLVILTHGVGHADMVSTDSASGQKSKVASSFAKPANVHRMIANMPGATCKKSKWGALQCASGDWSIEIDEDGCRAKRGAYGKVYSDDPGGILLRRSLPADRVEVEAKLRSEEFVCVAAVARGPGSQAPQWYYVMAIPVQSVKACAAKPFCAKPGDLPIEWMRPTTGQRCHTNARGRYEGDCAAGWVKAEEFGEYSMGL